MFETLKNAWKLESLRKKIIFTVFVIMLFRLGSDLLIPFLEPDMVLSYMYGVGAASEGNPLKAINDLMGSNLGQATVFSLGVQPYINASIIIQLLTVAIPALERLQKEGEEGRKKLNKISQIATMILASLQAVAQYLLMTNIGLLRATTGAETVLYAITIILILVAGASLCVWLGNQVNEYGLGNGISILIFAGVISRIPAIIERLVHYFQLGLAGQTKYLFLSPLMLLVYIAMVVGIIYVTEAERRIPVQYAKKVVGRKVYGGQNTYIPIKVNMAGVLPVIFASTFLSIPSLVLGFFPAISENKTGIGYNILNWFRSDTIQYGLINFALVFAFTFFYSSIQHDSMEMANNLRSNSGAIPGIRPGKPTADFIDKVVKRLNVIGGLFLALVAAVPTFLGLLTGMQDSLSLAGTSIIIVIGVALETVRAMESELMMRHYKGFL